eukprot:4546292-Prymnesium_polylepis.1
MSGTPQRGSKALGRSPREDSARGRGESLPSGNAAPRKVRCTVAASMTAPRKQHNAGLGKGIVVEMAAPRAEQTAARPHGVASSVANSLRTAFSGRSSTLQWDGTSQHAAQLASGGWPTDWRRQEPARASSGAMR